MKHSVHAIPHQSRPVGARQLPPGGSQGGTVRIRLGYHEAIGAYRNPSVSPCGLPAPPSGSQGGWYEFAQGFLKPQVPTANPSAVAAAASLSGALFSLPPLGEVPRSGKGGAVGIFDLLPFNEPHPLSQAVRPASSPIGEPRKPLRIRLGFHKTSTAYRETPQPLRRQLSSALSGCTPSRTATPAKPFRGA